MQTLFLIDVSIRINKESNVRSLIIVVNIQRNIIDMITKFEIHKIQARPRIYWKVINAIGSENYSSWY